MQYNLNESHDSPQLRPSPAKQGLQQALAARERFLERHPHLPPVIMREMATGGVNLPEAD